MIKRPEWTKNIIVIYLRQIQLNSMIVIGKFCNKICKVSHNQNKQNNIAK